MGWCFAFVSRTASGLIVSSRVRTSCASRRLLVEGASWHQLHTSTQKQPGILQQRPQLRRRSGGGIQLVNGRAVDFLAPLLPDAAQEIATSLHLDSAMAAHSEQQTSCCPWTMSALPPKADITQPHCMSAKCQLQTSALSRCPALRHPAQFEGYTQRWGKGPALTA